VPTLRRGPRIRESVRALELDDLHETNPQCDVPWENSDRDDGRGANEALPVSCSRPGGTDDMVAHELIVQVARELVVLIVVVAFVIWVAYRLVRESRR
jgi:hypothetical protein